MMSLQSIVAMNNEAAKQAEADNLEPREAVCDGDETIQYMPKLGDHVPDGFELVETYFVDGSGCGSEDEPALTFEQFLIKVKRGRFYALGKEGQFQVHVHCYKEI